MVRTGKFQRFEMKLFPTDVRLFKRVMQKQGLDFKSQAVRMALRKIERGK